MRFKKLKLSVILFLGFGLTEIQSQESFNTTGNNASGQGGSMSFSIGQVFYSANLATIGSVTQGVQQPFEFSVVTRLERTKGINLYISAYPNPTADYLTLEVKDFDLSGLYYQLYDASGKLLQNKKIRDNQTRIVMSNLVPATYFVKVIQGSQSIKTFITIKF